MSYDLAVEPSTADGFKRCPRRSFLAPAGSLESACLQRERFGSASGGSPSAVRRTSKSRCETRIEPYLSLAMNHEAVLITEDKKLKNAAENIGIKMA